MALSHFLSSFPESVFIRLRVETGEEFLVTKLTFEKEGSCLLKFVQNVTPANADRPITIPGMKGDVLKSIIDYADAEDKKRALCGDIISITRTAHKLEIKSMVETCTGCLQEILNVNRECDILGIWLLARELEDAVLGGITKGYALRSLVYVSTHSLEFWHLTVDEFEELIRLGPQIHEHDGFIDSLLEWVRSCRPSSTVCQQVEDERNPIERFARYNAAQKELCLKAAMEMFVQLKEPLLSCVIYAVGGRMDTVRYHANIEKFDLESLEWTKIKSTPDLKLAYHVCVLYESVIYVIGGENYNYVSLGTCLAYSIPTDKMWSISPMNVKRSCLSAVVIEGYIYAIGGHDQGIYLDTAERYDRRTDQWSMIASMNYSRGNASAAVLNNYIYVVGGETETEYLKSVEMYNPLADSWLEINSMRVERSGLAAVEVNNEIYAVGGHNETGVTNCVEKYNPLKRSWELVERMLCQRYNFGAVATNACIFIVGGYGDDDEILGSIERYNVTIDRWKHMGEFGTLGSCFSAVLEHKRHEGDLDDVDNLEKTFVCEDYDSSEDYESSDLSR